MDLAYLSTCKDAEHFLYDRKRLAMSISKSRYSGFVFTKIDHPETDTMEYILSQPTKRIKNMIKRCVYYNGD